MYHSTYAKERKGKKRKEKRKEKKREKRNVTSLEVHAQSSEISIDPHLINRD